jgi:uncharacterized membrane protein YdcZ (DUF606 family)
MSAWHIVLLLTCCTGATLCLICALLLAAWIADRQGRSNHSAMLRYHKWGKALGVTFVLLAFALALTLYGVLIDN